MQYTFVLYKDTEPFQLIACLIINILSFASKYSHVRNSNEALLSIEAFNYFQFSYLGYSMCWSSSFSQQDLKITCVMNFNKMQ